MAEFLIPDWPAPPGVRALSTLRGGGVSKAPYDSFNLGAHCGDDPASVARNRELLVSQLGLPRQPIWLSQVHGKQVIQAPDRHPDDLNRDGQSGDGLPIEADAIFNDKPGQVCAVLTADCLPVLLCSTDGAVVSAIHCGWRGLARGILGAALDALSAPGRQWLAWLGPAIGPDAFQVGPEVRDAFTRRDPSLDCAFQPDQGDRMRADLYQIARIQLTQLGVSSIHGGGFCTYNDSQRFFSYRRDGQCGRMISAIWLESGV